MDKRKEPVCPNCGEKGAHFAPPCFGDEGFFICEEKKPAPKETEEKENE